MFTFGKKLSVSAIICVLLLSCSNPADRVKTDGKSPGQFAAVALSGSQANSAARNVTIGSSTIQTSRSIYFILKNIGDYSISNITIIPGILGSNNSGSFVPLEGNDFVVSPAAINEMLPSNTSSIETLVQIDVNHGDIIGALYQSNLIDRETQGVTIHINGITSDGTDNNIPVSIDVDLYTLIKVASFDVCYSLDNGDTFLKIANYRTSNYGYGVNYFGIPGESLEAFYSADAYITIKNTGNVPIQYRNLLYFPGNYTVWTIIQPDDFSERLVGENGGVGSYAFQIDTMGVVFDNQGIDNLVLKAGSTQVIDTGEGAGANSSRQSDNLWAHYDWGY